MSLEKLTSHLEQLVKALENRIGARPLKADVNPAFLDVVQRIGLGDVPREPNDSEPGVSISLLVDGEKRSYRVPSPELV